MTKGGTTMKIAQLAGATVLASLLAACGGGGSSGGGGGLPAPIATATPTSAPVTAQFAGKAVDFTSGSGLSGFTVSTSPYNTATAFTPVATTAADGSFTVTALTAGKVAIQIAPPAGIHYATFHGAVTLVAGANNFGPAKISALSAEEQAEIALINSDRASRSLAAEVPDEFAMEAARAHVNDMAGLSGLGAPYFAHPDRNGIDPNTRYAASGGIGGDSENICGGATPTTYAACDASYIAEGPPAAGTVNHFGVEFSALNIWIGVATASTTGSPLTTLFDEEYVQYPF